MTERQKQFAEHYAACGNAAQAAREAGYSEKTARSQGQRLLTDVDIADYIRELQEKATDGRIASISEVKEFWSRVMNDPEEKTSDRLKASELLAKAAGAFLTGHDDDDDQTEDVVIYLPAINTVEACTYHAEDEQDHGE